jgi:signal transduction histidine kinase
VTSPVLRLFTPQARRHIALMLHALKPLGRRLELRFGRILRARYRPAQVRALLALTPAAAASTGSLAAFLEQVDYFGRRLAKLNVPTGEVKRALADFSQIADQALNGRFQPAREQLHLATVLALESAFHQVREAEAQVFFGLYRSELEASGLSDLLDRFVRILTAAFGAAAGRVLLPEEPVAGRLARPLYVERGHRDENLVASGNLRRGFACYWSYPLQRQALIQFAFAKPYPWLPRELALLEAVGQRCLEAIERARLRGEVRRLEVETRHAEEEERRRIGRELHDEAGQSMLLVRLQLEMMERDALNGLRARLHETRTITERTILELRRIVAALSPAVLERLGLEAALRQLGARFRRVLGTELSVRITSGAGGIPREAQGVIYRVAQECLQNIARHSRATSVNLSFRAADKCIRLSVRDNGAGFCTDTAFARPMSFGLTGMQERAALLGGTLRVISAPGKGTLVTLELPRHSAQVGSHVKDSSSSH